MQHPERFWCNLLMHHTSFITVNFLQTHAARYHHHRLWCRQSMFVWRPLQQVWGGGGTWRLPPCLCSKGYSCRPSCAMLCNVYKVLFLRFLHTWTPSLSYDVGVSWDPCLTSQETYGNLYIKIRPLTQSSVLKKIKQNKYLNTMTILGTFYNSININHKINDISNTKPKNKRVEHLSSSSDINGGVEDWLTITAAAVLHYFITFSCLFTLQKHNTTRNLHAGLLTADEQRRDRTEWRYVLYLCRWSDVECHVQREGREPGATLAITCTLATLCCWCVNFLGNIIHLKYFLCDQRHPSWWHHTTDIHSQWSISGGSLPGRVTHTRPYPSCRARQDNPNYIFMSGSEPLLQHKQSLWFKTLKTYVYITITFSSRISSWMSWSYPLLTGHKPGTKSRWFKYTTDRD